MTTVVSLTDGFLARLAEVPDEYIQCRTTQHKWDEIQRLRVVDTNNEEGRYARGGYVTFAERRLRCARCQMVRSDAFHITSAEGHTALRSLGSTYPEIPPGYYVKGQGRLDRALVLGVLFERAMALPV
jgi:hypothetical protein